MERRRGFTLIEVATAIMVGGILLSFAVTAFGSVRSRYAVREASNAFTALHARARAQAIEYAQLVELNVAVEGDSIWIERNDTTLEKLRFAEEFGVRMTRPEASFRLCFNSRGYGDLDCGSLSVDAGAVTVVFENGADADSLEVLPTGLVR